MWKWIPRLTIYRTRTLRNLVIALEWKVGGYAVELALRLIRLTPRHQRRD